MKSYAADIKGKVVDGATGEPLSGAIVRAISSADTTKVAAASAAKDGTFEITNLAPQTYTIKVAFLGYGTYSKQVSVPEKGLNTGKISMQTDALEIENVEVKGVAVRAVQRGDTTEFNADAYKVASDASTEDLIKKMPGISVENGTVKTQGEDVKKVLVDGKPFFGDDPTVAIRNLPAEMVESIEVYDRLSDQAQLTGFDDGESVRTINIKTRKNRRVGQFGRIYGGIGYDDKQDELRWTAGGNVNFFTDKRRVSIVGMSNNVNQQNFASEDLSGISSGSGGGGGGRRGGGMFFGGQSGVATTHAAGINYTDIWKENTEITGSYFINYSDKDNSSDVFRNYVHKPQDTLTQTYDASSESGSRTQNHRANLRIDHDFNDNTSLLVEPAMSFTLSDRQSSSATNMMYIRADNSPFMNNIASNSSDGSSHNLNANGNILFRHKFEKKGRSFSLRVNGNYSDANSLSNVDNYTDYMRYDYDPRDSTREQNKYRSDNPTNNWGVRSNAVYTEPLGAKSLLQLNYDFNYSYGESNKRTNRWDDNGDYTKFDSLLSNIYSNDYYTNRAGLSYRFNNGIINANAGVSYQYAELVGDRIMPRGSLITAQFKSFLPNARIEFKPTKQQTLRLFYRSSTNAPSISQLQDVIDNSNSQLLSSGNPDLRQTNGHMLAVNFNQTTLDKGMTFFAALWGNMVNDYITNTTITNRGEDLLLRRQGSDSVILRRGAEFRQPINMDGYFSTRANLNFGIPVSLLKSNLNITSSATYTRQPGRINAELDPSTLKVKEGSGDINYANSYSGNLGLMLGSNISENVDFNIGYNATYNNTINTLQSGSDNSYFRHNANARITWTIWRGFVLYSVVNYDQYRSLSGLPYDETFVKWDGGFGKKFWNKQAELKIMAYDILNRTNNYARSVTDNYIEDSWSRVLTRYFMLTFTYTLRSFGTPAQRRSRDGDEQRPSGPPPGAMMRGGGGFGPPPM
jgi:hypothetical protein